MGRVLVAGLDFSMDYLHSEIAAFRALILREGWWDDLESRKATIKGLTFIMLNLHREADENEAWPLFHQALDEYYDLCDRFRVTY